MNRSRFREVIIASSFMLLSAAASLGSASAQEPESPPAPASAEDPESIEDEYLMGDVPDWLEDYGYEDTHDDRPTPRLPIWEAAKAALLASATASSAATN